MAARKKKLTAGKQFGRLVRTPLSEPRETVDFELLEGATTQASIVELVNAHFGNLAMALAGGALQSVKVDNGTARQLHVSVTFEGKQLTVNLEPLPSWVCKACSARSHTTGCCYRVSPYLVTVPAEPSSDCGCKATSHKTDCTYIATVRAEDESMEREWERQREQMGGL